MICVVKTCLEIVTIKVTTGTQCVVRISSIFIIINLYTEGKPHSNYALWLTTTGCLGLLGAFTYAYCLKDRNKKKME